jgi:uncharacterized protein HemX
MTKKKITIDKGNIFWTSFKGAYKVILAALALAAAFYAFDTHYAKSEDLKKQGQQTTEDLKRQEQSTVKTLEMFQGKIEGKYLQDRLTTLQDQRRQIILMLKKTPRDIELQDQYNEVVGEIKKTKEKIDETQKK